MPDAMPTPAAAPAPAAAGAPAPTPQPVKPQGEAPRPHHSATQPRDDGKRFAGPPGAAPEKPKEEAPPPPAAPRKIPVRFKERGQEVVEELTEEELIESHRRHRALAYKEKVATERLQRAGDMSKQAAEAQDLAKAIADGDYSKLSAYYQRNGKDSVEVLAGMLEKALDERDMSPEQRELAQLRAEKAELQAAQERQQEEQHTTAFMKEVDGWREKLHGTWSAALDSGELPKTEQMLEAVSEIFLEALDATGGKNMPTDEQIIGLARFQMLDSTARPLVNSMEVPQFLKHFGGEGGIVQKIDQGMTPEQALEAFPGLFQRIHRHLVAQAKAQVRGVGGRQAQPQQRQATPQQGQEQTPEGSAMDPWIASRIGKR